MNAQDFKDTLLRRGQDYQRLFQGPLSDRVLADLFRFCGVMSPSIRVSPQQGTVDPLAMAVAEGRREVALRIASLCHMSFEQVSRIIEADQ